MIRHPVVKDLEGAAKTHKFGPIALETRQGAILAVTFVFYSLVCFYLAEWFGFSTNRAALAFSWVLVIAFAFAFVKRDGYHLDWWLEKLWLRNMRPGVLLFKRRDPVNPDKPVRDSVQEAIPAESFEWEMLRCKDGTYLITFEITPVALSLVGDTERSRVFNSTRELYSRIDFPIVEFTRSREGSTARYTRRLADIIKNNISSSEEEMLDTYAYDHLAFVERVVPSYNIYERRGYLLLPYNPSEEGNNPEGQGSIWGALKDLLRSAGILGAPKAKPSKKDAQKRQREAEQAYSVLTGRAQVIYDGMQRMGCRARALTDLEFLAFAKGQASSYDEDLDPEPTLYTPISLEPGGYEMLSEERRHELTLAAEEYRQDAPPALGIGDLSVADKIAPDAVEVFPDFLRVDDQYHTTMFVGEWADEVYFGMLESLTHIDGRIKVVKYLTPRPKDEALKTLGSRLAQLRASMRTADDGDVRASQQRDVALFTVEQAMSELTADRQRFLELSILIHCEADSEEELASMAEQVRTTLAAWRTTARLAREEAWEGFLSCLPLGRNYLSKRYVSKGMLTNPLACLFSYSTHQIDHERGVFLGVDQRSGAVMTLDTRQNTNPHSVIIGQSGGGKSFVIKALTTRQRMLGHRIVIIDPEGNSGYAPVARQVGGAFAMIAPGSPHKINPWDLHPDYMNISLLEDAASEDEDPEQARQMAHAAALDGKVQELTRMVSLMLASDTDHGAASGGLSGAEAGYVEQTIYETYERRQITKDPATHDREPPIFPEFFAILAEREQNNDEIKALREKLYSWEAGALSKLFDSQTTVDLNNKFLVFQVSKVRDRQKAPVMHAILEFMNGVLSNPDEPSDCVVDEGWSLLKFKMSAEFAETMYRSGRARNNAMCFASQNPVEFVGSEQGQVILDLAATHMIFRHEHRKAAEATASIYDLAEEEIKNLLNLQPGEGLLVIDQNRINMQVLGSTYEEALFNTDPKKREWAKQVIAEHHESRRSKTAARATRRSPEPEDSAAIHSTGAQDDGHEDDQEEKPMRVYTFHGDRQAAARAAAAAAKLLGAEGEQHGSYVLAVDATGGELSELLATDEHPPPEPDEYLAAGMADVEELGSYVATCPGLRNLKVVGAPASTDLPAGGLLEAADEVFEVCIVACSDNSPYAADWTGAADRVVGCSTEGVNQALSAALGAEHHTGRNGSLIATLSASDAASTNANPTDAENTQHDVAKDDTPDSGGRPLFVLSHNPHEEAHLPPGGLWHTSDYGDGGSGTAPDGKATEGNGLTPDNGDDTAGSSEEALAALTRALAEEAAPLTHASTTVSAAAATTREGEE